MWVFNNAVPEKTVMVYAMVFGAHPPPYSWLYKSAGYNFFAIAIPFIALTAGSIFNGFAVAAVLSISEILFALILFKELKQIPENKNPDSEI